MHESIKSLLDATASANPQALAIAARNRSPLNHTELAKHVDRSVKRLNELGLGRGDRVAIVLPNGPEMAVLSLSVMASAVALPINPDYKETEYVAVFERLQPRALLAFAGDHAARRAAKSCGITLIDVLPETNGSAGVFSLESQGVLQAPDRPGYNKNSDTALLLQTSGTTARPKIVPLSQGNLLASVTNLVHSLDLSASDRCLHFLPMFHIGGLLDVLLAPLSMGGAVFCAPSFSGPDFYRDLATFRPTWTQAVPVMLEEMLHAAPEHKELVAGHSLRFMRSVSAPLPVARMAELEQTFNVPVIEIYGMSETAGVLASNPLPPGIRKAGSVGLPVQNVEIRIVHKGDDPVKAGEEGEIQVRGANVISGYEDAPDENAASFVDGWFRTGDLGRYDEASYLYLTGRVKDMINRGGEKVSPNEIDAVLLAHPAIADAATFAIPHDALGEDIAVVVVLKPEVQLAASELQAYLRERVAFFKVPRALHFIDQIPRTGGGKLQRSKLSELYGAASAQGSGQQADFVAPKTPVSKMLAALWQDILRLPAVGMNDDFFAIGGDSLKAASFINSLQQQWGDTIYVSSLFDAPTLEKYEQYLQVHYPELVARMLGQYMAPSDRATEKVTPEMLGKLQDMLAHPLGPLVKPTSRNPRAIFVLSPPRSGSTLLRAMLAGHPGLFAPPELYLLSYENLADRKRWFSGSHRSQLEGNIRALMQLRHESAESCQALMNELEERACTTQEYYRMMQEWLGDRLLVDKTPAYAVDPAALERAEAYFEEPIYIHLLRHPYGMIRSFEEAKLDQLWFPRLVGTDAHSLEAFPFGRRQLAEMVWLMLHRNILDFLSHIPAQRQYRLRFEQVVSDPESAMRGLCNAIGLPFSAEMLAPQGDKKERMTDGIHDVSRMIGDPKFHQHKKIESAVADQWKSAYETDFLCQATVALATELGYQETVAGARGRVEFEL